MKKVKSHPRRTGSTYFLMAIVTLYLLLFFPFWRPVLLGFIFAAAFSPTISHLRKSFHTRRNHLAYLLMVGSIGFFIVIMVVFSVNLFSSFFQILGSPQLIESYTQKILVTPEHIMRWAEKDGLVLSGALRSQVIQAVLALAGSVKSFLLDEAQNFVKNAPEIFLSFFIFLLTFALVLVSGQKVWLIASELFNLNSEQREKFHEFERICARTLGALVVVGLGQAAVITFGAAVAGYPAYLIIFIGTFLFSFVPLLGATSIPCALAFMSLTNENSQSALILIATAVISISVENILRVWLFSKNAKTNGIISFISLMGALSLIGIAGLVIAPVLEQLVMSHLFHKKDDVLNHEVEDEFLASTAANKIVPQI